MQLFILADDHATRSCHKVKEWEVEADSQEEAHHVTVAGWNIATMLEEDAHAADNPWAYLAEERAHL